VTITDLHDEVKLLADPKAGKRADGALIFNKNALTGFVSRHVGTTLAGYVLKSFRDETLSRPKTYYRVSYAQEPA
jgi:hypothetical protein